VFGGYLVCGAETHSWVFKDNHKESTSLRPVHFFSISNVPTRQASPSQHQPINSGWGDSTSWSQKARVLFDHVRRREARGVVVEVGVVCLVHRQADRRLTCQHLREDVGLLPVQINCLGRILHTCHRWNKRKQAA
jgi:hypothetical protein